MKNFSLKQDNINLLLRLTEIQKGKQLSVTPATGDMSLLANYSPGK